MKGNSSFPNLSMYKAPGWEFIHEIISTPNKKTLLSYFNARTSWQANPIIHDRFISYSLFYDLISNLPQDESIVGKCLDLSFDIFSIEFEDRYYVFCCLAFVLELARLYNKIGPLTAECKQRISSLSWVVDKCNHLPNITCYSQQLDKLCK